MEFIEYLSQLDIHVEIYGIDVRETLYDIKQYLPKLNIRFRSLDMTDIGQLQQLLHELVPDYVLHLAAYKHIVGDLLTIFRDGLVSGEIETGDITVVREFVDVRDVVRAYYILLESGKAGEVYNASNY